MWTHQQNHLSFQLATLFICETHLGHGGVEVSKTFVQNLFLTPTWSCAKCRELDFESGV